MCPYSRFQAAMFDNSTSLVTYNKARGETRGPRKRYTAPSDKGDCVDCKLCVQVCPAGIDIREGLQYECINCGLCIDACDKVMNKFGYATKLIGFRRQQAQPARTFTNYLYGIAIIVILVAMAGWAIDRQDFEAGISRDRNALYRENSAGRVENTYTLTLLNKARTVKSFTIEIENQSSLRITGAGEFSVAPGEKRIVPFSVEAMKRPGEQMSNVRFTVTDLESNQASFSDVTFYSGG